MRPPPVLFPSDLQKNESSLGEYKTSHSKWLFPTPVQLAPHNESKPCALRSLTGYDRNSDRQDGCWALPKDASSYLLLVFCPSLMGQKGAHLITCSPVPAVTSTLICSGQIHTSTCTSAHPLPTSHPPHACYPKVRVFTLFSLVNLF